MALEACATAHYRGRALSQLGHRVKLIPPSCVKPYVKRNKNDAHDAQAICEASCRPEMRFVPIKTEEQQGALMQHRARELLIEHRTALINAIRAHLAEYGVIAPKGNTHVFELLALVDVDDAQELQHFPAAGQAV